MNVREQRDVNGVAWRGSGWGAVVWRAGTRVCGGGAVRGGGAVGETLASGGGVL